MLIAVSEAMISASQLKPMFSQRITKLAERYEDFCANRAEAELVEIMMTGQELSYGKLKKIVRHMYWDLSLQRNEHGCYYIQDDIQKQPTFSAPVGSLERIAQWMFDGVLECRKAKKTNASVAVAG